jgi:hypothetical protein
MMPREHFTSMVRKDMINASTSYGSPGVTASPRAAEPTGGAVVPSDRSSPTTAGSREKRTARHALPGDSSTGREVDRRKERLGGIVAVPLVREKQLLPNVGSDDQEAATDVRILMKRVLTPLLSVARATAPFTRTAPGFAAGSAWGTASAGWRAWRPAYPSKACPVGVERGFFFKAAVRRLRE